MEVIGQLIAPAALSQYEGAPIALWIGIWVNPRAVLDALEKRHVSCPYLELNLK
jgi:enhancing lycopene biosynthesis protein 2